MRLLVVFLMFGGFRLGLSIVGGFGFMFVGFVFVVLVVCGRWRGDRFVGRSVLLLMLTRLMLRQTFLKTEERRIC